MGKRSEAERARRRGQERLFRQKRRLALIYWVLTHLGEVRKYQEEVVRLRRLRWRLKNHVRRQRLRSGGNPKRLSPRVVDRVMGLQKSRCAVCRDYMGPGFVVDHILPLALGGNNDPKNIQLLCEPCNQAKWHKHPVDFMQSRGFLL